MKIMEMLRKQKLKQSQIKKTITHFIKILKFPLAIKTYMTYNRLLDDFHPSIKAMYNVVARAICRGNEFIKYNSLELFSYI